MPLRFRILSPPAAGQPDQGQPGQTVLATDRATGTVQERTFELTTDTAEVRLGRQPSFEIELPFPAVSVFHARLFRGESAQEWWLEDQGSTNGTWLDGTRLAPRRPALIRAGQRMRIGSVDIVFEGWAATVKGDESTATIARRLISDLFGAPGNDVPALALESGRATPPVLRLTERERRYVAGRAETCDVVLAGDQASREHAAFERRWDGVFVSDLGSRNGLLVNGAGVTGVHRLRDGDSVQLGGATLRFTDPEDRYLRRLEADEESADVKAAPALATPTSEAQRALPLSATRAAPERPRLDAPAALPSSGETTAPGRPPMSGGRKVAMAIAAAVLLAAVTGLILLLEG